MVITLRSLHPVDVGSVADVSEVSFQADRVIQFQCTCSSLFQWNNRKSRASATEGSMFASR
jgi:hypothetical protein